MYLISLAAIEGKGTEGKAGERRRKRGHQPFGY